MRKEGDLAEHLQGFYRSRRGVSPSNRPSRENRETKRSKMEKVIGQETLREIDQRIPDALRHAFGIRRRVLPLPEPGGHDEVASFACALLAPREDGDGESSERSDDDAPRGGLRMEFESRYLKDHDEDAHFGHAENGVLGVADGVGAYRRRGVDAGAFSNSLMEHAFLEVVSAAPGTHVCPLTLLERAYQATVALRTAAASTAVILSLAGRTLRWAYVGDSGFAVFRDGRLLRLSRAQQHYFNCPLQLNASGTSSSATAGDAEVGEVPAKEGDVVVVGTDGLFDNVSDDELERIVRMGTAMGFSPRNMAEVIAGFAHEAARCAYRDTPYSVQSRKEKGTTFTGGKPDDITVIVAFIVSQN
jgi:protein phosphatase PTC7